MKRRRNSLAIERGHELRSPARADRLPRPSSTPSSRRRSSRSKRPTTTSASSTIGANRRAPTWSTAGCRARNGRRCCAEAKRRADAAGHLRFAWPKEYGRQRRLQPGDGGDPRAPGRQGPRPAQRPAERALDRRQQPLHHHVQGFREPEQRALHRGLHHRRISHRLRPDRAGPRLRRHPHGDPRRAQGAKRRPRLADQRREDVDHRHARRHYIARSSPAPRGRTATPTASPASSCRPTASRREGRGVPVDLQHADRPPARQLHRRLGCRRRAVAASSARACGRPVLRAPEPHPPGGVVAGRGGLLHQREREVRRADASRSASRWPTTRRSSGRWSSCTPRPRCCGC